MYTVEDYYKAISTEIKFGAIRGVLEIVGVSEPETERKNAYVVSYIKIHNVCAQ